MNREGKVAMFVMQWTLWSAIGVVFVFAAEWGAPRVPLDTYSEPDRIMAEHDCWSGPSPYGEEVVPKHAVYSLPGEGPTYGPAKVGFGIWLNEKPGRLHGFCR